MENKHNFLTPNVLDITYEDFCKLVEAEMQKVEREYRQTPIKERAKCLQIWVSINIDLIPGNYLTWLKDELIKLGWSDVKVEKQNDRSSCVYICLIK